MRAMHGVEGPPRLQKRKDFVRSRSSWRRLLSRSSARSRCLPRRRTWLMSRPSSIRERFTRGLRTRQLLSTRRTLVPSASYSAVRLSMGRALVAQVLLPALTTQAQDFITLFSGATTQLLLYQKPYRLKMRSVPSIRQKN